MLARETGDLLRLVGHAGEGKFGLFSGRIISGRSGTLHDEAGLRLLQLCVEQYVLPVAVGRICPVEGF
jgi:hypothetical protein